VSLMNSYINRTGERSFEAEIHRLEGELLLMTSEPIAKAEASFHKVIEVARRQQAKSWELRATMSLARLWQKQGKKKEARKRLEAIYSWFTRVDVGTRPYRNLSS
jgi:predicted ATPase